MPTLCRDELLVALIDATEGDKPIYVSLRDPDYGSSNLVITSVAVVDGVTVIETDLYE